jgi:hypothetical protein
MVRINPDAVPAEVKEWLKNEANKIAITGDLPEIFSLYNVIDMYEMLGLPDLKDNKALREGIITKYLSRLTGDGGLDFFSSSQIDPVSTFMLLKITNSLGINYPHQEKLLNIIEKHRVKQGWYRFSILMLSGEATYYAMSLANKLGVGRKYDIEKITAYLKKNINEEKNWEQPREIYFSLLAYKMINKELPEEIKDKVSLKLKEKTKDFFKSNRIDAMTYCILIADEFGVDPRVDSQQLIAFLKSFSGYLDNPNIKILFYYSILGNFAGYNLKEEITAKLSTLNDGSGSFKAANNSPIPDVDSTFYAVYLLDKLGKKGEIKTGSIVDFIENCRVYCGFNLAPKELLEKYNILSSPFFYLTYEAVWLIEYCGSLQAD